MRILFTGGLLFFLVSCNSNNISKIKSKQSDSLTYKSKYFLEQNQLDSASILIKAALNLDSGNYAAYNNSAYLKYKKKLLAKEIIADYRKSIQLKPNYEVAVYSLANYYYEINDYENTIETCNDYLKLSRINHYISKHVERVIKIKNESEKYFNIINGITVLRAITFYDSINGPFDETHILQQKFIDTLTATIQNIRDGNIKKVNTNELKLLLDSAKMMGLKRFTAIQKITEIDKEIGYKNIAVTYAMLLNNMYSNQFAEYLNYLSTNGKKANEKAKTIILPELIKVKESEKKLKQTQSDFKNKYKFSAPDIKTLSKDSLPIDE